MKIGFMDCLHMCNAANDRVAHVEHCRRSVQCRPGLVLIVVQHD